MEGNLQEERLPEALETLALDRRTGILTVQGTEDIVAVSFAEGQVVAADSLNAPYDEMLGQKLLERGHLDPQRFDRLLTQTKEGPGLRFFDVLVEQAGLERTEILAALRDVVLDLLHAVLRWDAGEFKFYSGDDVSYEEGFRPIALEEWLPLRRAGAAAEAGSGDEVRDRQGRDRAEEEARARDKDTDRVETSDPSRLERVRLPLADILQTVARERKTGTVTVQGYDDFTAISCVEGEVLGAETLKSTLDTLLGEKLRANELLPPDGYDKVQAQRERTRRGLLEILLETPGLKRSTVLHTLRLAVLDLIVPLLNPGAEEKLEVRFYASDRVPYEEGFFPIPVAELLSLRSSDESVPSSQLARRIRVLERDLQELRRQVQGKRKWPTRFLELQQRTQSVLRSPATDEAAWHRLSSQALAARLRSHGFFLAPETCRALRTALLRKPIVVLEGVPGSGKSLLAQLLPKLLLEPHPKSETTHLAVSGHPSLAVEDFIGDRTILDGQIGPAAGHLLEALLRCHESTAGHWLIVDEFNRARADALFAPLLDALSHADGRLRHPHMFPDREVEEAEIPIPPTFRILGTMNHLDKGLFEISQALRQRIQIVPIPTLRGEAEVDLIQSKVLDPWRRDSVAGVSGHPPPPWLEDLATTASRRLHRVAERIRDLTARKPASQYAPCELGSRLVLESIQAMLLQLDESHREDGRGAEDLTLDDGALDELLDTTIQDIFLSQLSACGTDALEALLGEVLDASLPQTQHALRQILEARRVF